MPTTRTRNPWQRGAAELLAPAGDPDSAAAAARHGADAVYLGLAGFSARRKAGLDPAELARVVAFLHRRQVRAYLAANILLTEPELDPFAAACRTAAEAGIDAIIVQDLGAARLLRQILPDLPLHFSTQAALGSPDGLAAAKRLGAIRVVLPRETTLDEIRALRPTTPLALEHFVHGALCTAVSGLCHLSSFAGARSGNRGLCAQCCRLDYASPSGRGHLLSTGDLCLVDDLPALLAAGIDSFKIEGRLKKPSYVGLVVAAYRRALDDPREAAASRALLERAYHRPLTRGYLAGPHPELVRAEQAGNVGSAAGEVLGYDAAKGEATVRLTQPLSAGDGIDLRGKVVVAGQSVPPMWRDGRKVFTAGAGETVRFAVKKPVFPGDKIHITKSDALEAEYRATFPENEPPAGRPVRITLAVADGRATLSAGLAPAPYEQVLDLTIEAARDKATPEASIAETLKTYDREFTLETTASFTCDVPVFLPLSALKKATKAFKEQLVKVIGERGLRLQSSQNTIGGPGPQAPAGVRGQSPRVALILASPRLPDGVAPDAFDALVPTGETDRLTVPAAPTRAGWRLNVLNSLTAAALAELGYSGVTLTPEARPADLLALPPALLAASDLPVFGRYLLAEIRHDLGATAPAGAPTRWTSTEGETLAVRDGGATRLYPGGFFSLLRSLPALYARGARRFLFQFPLLDADETRLAARVAANAEKIKVALSAGDDRAWEKLVNDLLIGFERRVLERRGHLE